MNLNKQVLLCVNIDHVATLRQARGGIYPSVVEAAQLTESAGADGITIHLREDRRHIQDADVFELKEIIRGRYTLEMAASQEILEIAKKIKPDLLTIVPEKRQELTTEGGLNVIGNASELKEFLLEVKKANLQASLFIDPDLSTIEKAREIGASRIELHTGKYANCPINSPEAESEFQNLKKAAEFAHSIGFIVNAGHGLNLPNLPKILQIPNLEELHIGHSIIARAVIVGLNQAVKEIKDILK